MGEQEVTLGDWVIISRLSKTICKDDIDDRTLGREGGFPEGGMSGRGLLDEPCLAWASQRRLPGSWGAPRPPPFPGNQVPQPLEELGREPHPHLGGGLGWAPVPGDWL